MQIVPNLGVKSVESMLHPTEEIDSEEDPSELAKLMAKRMRCYTLDPKCYARTVDPRSMLHPTEERRPLPSL